MSDTLFWIEAGFAALVISVFLIGAIILALAYLLEWVSPRVRHAVTTADPMDELSDKEVCDLIHQYEKFAGDCIRIRRLPTTNERTQV